MTKIKFNPYYKRRLNPSLETKKPIVIILQKYP